MQAADLVSAATATLKKLESILREIERFGPPHENRILELLRQSQSEELEKVRNRVLQEAKKKESDDEMLNWALEQGVRMFPDVDQIGSSVVRIAVGPKVSYVATDLMSATQKLVVGLARERDALILEPAAFLKVVEAVKGSIAASTEKDRLCRPAQELIYKNVRARYGDLLGVGTTPGAGFIP